MTITVGTQGLVTCWGREGKGRVKDGFYVFNLRDQAVEQQCYVLKQEAELEEGVLEREK